MSFKKQEFHNLILNSIKQQKVNEFIGEIFAEALKTIISEFKKISDDKLYRFYSYLALFISLNISGDLATVFKKYKKRLLKS